MSKSTLCRLLLEADRRMIKAFLRDHKAQVAAPHGQRDDPQASSSSSSCPSRTERETPPAVRFGVTAGGQGLWQAEREGRGEGVGVGKGVREGGGLDDGVAEISGKMGDISMSSNRMADEADPSCPAGETTACIEGAWEVLSTLEDTSKM